MLTKLNLDRALLLSVVPRWTIVPMLRTQSVAEHSYRVHILSMSLYDCLVQLPHNSDERQLVSQYSLYHDLAEVVTSDLPTPVKARLNVIHPGITRQVEAEVIQELSSTIGALGRAIKGTVAEAIIKIADLVEAYQYLSAYRVVSSHTDAVMKDIVLNLYQAYLDSKNDYGHIGDWSVVLPWIIEATDGAILKYCGHEAGLKGSLPWNPDVNDDPEN